MIKMKRWLAVALALCAAILPGMSEPARVAGMGPAAPEVLGGGAPPLLYQFSGVRDDGAKGVGGKSATAITCSNPTADQAAILLELINYSGSPVYSLSFTLGPGITYTASTQPTGLYIEDYFFHSSTSDSGTDAINQGMGRIFSSIPAVFCTATMLDPSGDPPRFVTRLTLHTPGGQIARKAKHLFMPSVLR